MIYSINLNNSFLLIFKIEWNIFLSENTSLKFLDPTPKNNNLKNELSLTFLKKKTVTH
jgi:hypothetical protein